MLKLSSGDDWSYNKGVMESPNGFKHPVISVGMFARDYDRDAANSLHPWFGVTIWVAICCMFLWCVYVIVIIIASEPTVYENKNKQLYTVLIGWLWKENVNSNCQQFHQYQQNEPISFISLNTKHTTTFVASNRSVGLRQAKQCSGVLLLNGITIFVLFYNRISNVNTEIKLFVLFRH